MPHGKEAGHLPVPSFPDRARGARSVPPGMAARVREEYGLDDEEAARLEAAQARSAARFMVMLEGATACQREAASLFGNSFRDLTDAQCEAIKAVLQK